MALLPLLLPVKEAAVVVAVLNLVTCVFTLWAVRRHLCWRRGRSLIVGSAAGVPFGVYLLAHLEPAPLLRAMGIVLVVFAAAELLSAPQSRARVPGWLGLPAGFLGGSIGGALNMGGPPVIAYVYAQAWSKEEIVATLQLVFGVSALLRVTLIGAGGLGTFISRGISQTDIRQLITGALALGLLAIACDYSLLWLQRRLTPKGAQPRMS